MPKMIRLTVSFNQALECIDVLHEKFTLNGIEGVFKVANEIITKEDFGAWKALGDNIMMPIFSCFVENEKVDKSLNELNKLLATNIVSNFRKGINRLKCFEKICSAETLRINSEYQDNPDYEPTPINPEVEDEEKDSGN